MTALIRFKPHGGGILDRNKRDGAVLVLGDTMKSASVWSDMSGRGNHGLVYGAGTPPAATPGALGYLFDGVDDYVDCGNNASLDITNAITISAWVKTSMASATYGANLVRKGGAAYFLSLGDGVASSPKVTGYLYINGDWRSLKGTTAVNDGNWHNALFTYDGSYLRVYRDGVIDATPLLYVGSINTDALALELGYYGLGFFNGSIDEVRIYNRALSAAEIKRYFERTRILFGV